jgi:nickel transport protein
MRRALLALTASIALAAPLQASSAFFVAERVSKPTVVMAEVSTDEAYDPAVLKTVSGFDSQDRPVTVPHQTLTDHVVLDPPENAATILLVADFGYHARAANTQKWTDGRKTQLPGTSVGLHAIKESVNLITSAPATLHPHGLQVEIVPLTDPFALKRGDTLPVRVLLRGKPLAGVRLQENFLSTMADQSPPTDKEGRTDVTLRADQFNVIQLTFEETIKGDPDVDFMRYNASLTFNLADADGH